MLKLLRNDAKIEIPNGTSDKITRAGICLWERDPNIHRYIATPPEECPVCGSNQFEVGKRLSALLNPRFESGFRYVMWVWVHPECFDDCIETSEPEPTPW